MMLRKDRKIKRTDGVPNEDTMRSVDEGRSITILRGNANWTGYVLGRSCLPRDVIEVSLGSRKKDSPVDGSFEPGKQYRSLKEEATAADGEQNLHIESKDLQPRGTLNKNNRLF